ncbi:hypothetical protein HK096_000174, partial [Nowakowskiella sp. JEL0078]
MHHAMIDQLQGIWGSCLSGKDIVWRIWAGEILNLLAHKQKQSACNPPLSDILSLFHGIPANKAQQLNQLWQ